MRNTLVQKITFTALKVRLEDYHLFFLLLPAPRNMRAMEIAARRGSIKGIIDAICRAGRASSGLHGRCAAAGTTCGYVGVSDAWQDLHRNGYLTQTYSRANEGNIALAAEVDLQACGGEFVIALGFAAHREEAALQTLSCSESQF